jgi:hypothetical protein
VMDDGVTDRLGPPAASVTPVQPQEGCIEPHASGAGRDATPSTFE